MPTTRCGGRTGTRTPRTSGSRCSDSRDRPAGIRADARLARPPIQATGSLAGDHGRGRVEVNDVDGLPEFIAILFEELEPYLDVRLRIAQRMKDEGIAALMGGTEA